MAQLQCALIRSPRTPRHQFTLVTFSFLLPVVQGSSGPFFYSGPKVLEQKVLGPKVLETTNDVFDPSGGTTFVCGVCAIGQGRARDSAVCLLLSFVCLVYIGLL